MKHAELFLDLLSRLLHQVRLAQSVAKYALDLAPESSSLSSYVMEHPLNAFFLIQRFRTVWQLIDELVLNTDAFQGQRIQRTALAVWTSHRRLLKGFYD